VPLRAAAGDPVADAYGLAELDAPDPYGLVVVEAAYGLPAVGAAYGLLAVEAAYGLLAVEAAYGLLAAGAP
jgi:hypothetical protein